MSAVGSALTCQGKDNLKDITLNINGRILSSFLEISHCSNLIVKFNGPVPATTQLDPNITNLKFIFMNGSEPASFVVAPRPMSSPEGIGLAQISVVLGEHGDKAEKVWSMVDSDGRIDMELMVSSEGKISEQYIIEMVKGGKMERWKMGAVEKISGGIPVLNENKVQH